MTVISESTAGDWDTFLDQFGVHHEQPTGTDFAAASEVQRGYESTVFNDMVCHIPMHEGSGTTANDISGNGNDGTFDSSVTLSVEGLLGATAYSFDGTGNSEVEIPNDPTLEADGPLSVAIWANAHTGATPSANWTYFVGKSDTGTGSDYALIWRATDDRVIFEIEHTGGGSYQPESTNTWGPSDGWTLWVGVYDGSDCILYKDGSEEDRVAAANAPNNTQAPLGLGGHPDADGGDRQFDGNHTYFMQWDRGITSQEVQDLYDIVTAEARYITDKKVS